MGKRRISLSGVAFGLLCALAWYLVLGFAAGFHLEDGPAEVHWGRVTIAAAISFIAGWGVVRLFGLLSSEPREEEDDQEGENLDRRT